MLGNLPLAAQRPLAAVGADPTHRVLGTGRLPSGWTMRLMRLDPIIALSGRPVPPAPRATDVQVSGARTMLHVRSGPAAIYYCDAEPLTGAYSVSATFTQAGPMGHEAYGLVIGGAELQRTSQRDLYFIIRPQDGGVLVSRRTSDARPTTLVPWHSDAAVHREDPRDGHAVNALTVRVGADPVWFVANGRVVRTRAAADLGVPTDRLAGVRVNHNLDVQVDGFRVERHDPR